jgi:Clostripain family
VEDEALKGTLMEKQRERTVEDTDLKDWALLVFMKPDAELETSAIADVEEMKQVQGTENVHIGVQIDRVNDVERLIIRNGKDSLDASPRPRPQTLEKSLQSFLEWGLKRFPAKYRMVVLWGHTRGVGFDLVGPRQDTPGLPFPSSFSGPANGRLNHAGSRSGGAAGPPPDGLSVPQIAGVMNSVSSLISQRSGQDSRKIDILGLDSCYMSSVEFSYQLRHSVDYIVASQTLIRSQGWNYRSVVSAMRDYSSKEPLELGKALVRQITALQGTTSLSLLDLQDRQQLEAFADAMLALVQSLALLVTDADEKRALKIFLERASYLKVRQFLDLRDVCHKLQEAFDGEVGRASRNVLDRLGEIIKLHEARERALGRLNGLSIFYPHVRVRGGIPETVEQDADVNAVVDPGEYKELDFVKHTGWQQLLDSLDTSRSKSHG